MKNIEIEGPLDEKVKPDLSWQNSPAVQKLLDVVCRILADEFIATVKENPQIFLKDN